MKKGIILKEYLQIIKIIKHHPAYPSTPHPKAQQAADHPPEYHPSSSHYYPKTATSNPPHSQASPTTTA
jgi:hypothetical protein